MPSHEDLERTLSYLEGAATMVAGNGVQGSGAGCHITSRMADNPVFPGNPLLRTEHLTKDYGRFRALDDLNLEVGSGEVFGLLGPNGSGKTTALRLLLGFLRPTAGHAWVAGHETWDDSVAVRRHISYLPGELRLYENMTGRGLVRFLCRLRGQPIQDNLADLARRFDIDLDRPIATLSSGMKRKVALLQVLAPHSPLLIMDEPTNTLDPTMRDELLAQVRSARARGQTVLFSSHVMSEVEAVCDRVAILRLGRLVHLQEMNQLRQGREIKARVTGVVPDLASLPGLELSERRGDQVTLEYSGPMPELLLWLARQPLTDLRMRAPRADLDLSPLSRSHAMTWTLVRKLLFDIRLALVVVALFLAAFQCLWAKITERILGQVAPFLFGLADASGLMPEDIEEAIFQGPGRDPAQPDRGREYRPGPGRGHGVDRLRPPADADRLLCLGHWPGAREPSRGNWTGAPWNCCWPSRSPAFG